MADLLCCCHETGLWPQLQLHWFSDQLRAGWSQRFNLTAAIFGLQNTSETTHSEYCNLFWGHFLPFQDTLDAKNMEGLGRNLKRGIVPFLFRLYSITLEPPKYIYIIYSSKKCLENP